MREHFTELLPLVLVGIVLLVFQLTRDGGTVLHFQPLAGVLTASTPTPLPAPQATSATRAGTPVASPTPVPALCAASSPTFVGGLAALKKRLGASMGQALECERAADNQGNSQQKTTTGLAYYRKHLNLACFTTGWDHWALTADGLVHWTGDAIDPPGESVD
jgi:hypothetical protein